MGAASVREIGERNIYQATALAMRRALARLSVVPDAVLVDGKPIRALGVEHTAVVKGDNKCYAIACASIVAKVVRDRLMQRLDARYPVYAWRTPFRSARSRAIFRVASGVGGTSSIL